jgi:oxygen-dependent protoporphyrinogen oxidase
MKTVAIIGGGITGLTAAFRLREKGVPVTVYEAGERVGGVIRTVREHGYIAECGPNTILETSPKISALISDLDLEPRRRYTNPGAEKNFVLRDGDLIAVPKTPSDFFFTRLFSPLAKLRVLCEPIISRCKTTSDEDVASFVKRRLGREFLDYAINPFVSGIYAGDPSRLSVRHAFPKLEEVEKRYRSLLLGQIFGARERRKRVEKSPQNARKFSFDDGLEVLIEALYAQLADATELRSQIISLRQNETGWSVEIQTPGGAIENEHTALILTAPAHKLAAIKLKCDADISLAPLSKIVHPPVASVALGFRREDVNNALDGFGFLVPKIEQLNILGTTFSSSLFDNRAPAGHVLLTSFIGGCRNPELALCDPGAAIEMTLRDLRSVLGVRGKITFAHHALFPKAIPQYEVGYCRFKSLMNDIEQKAAGLFFAGTFRDGISLGNSIVAGQDVAERIARFVSAQNHAQPALA